MSKGLDGVLNAPLPPGRRQAIYRLGVVASDFIRFWPIAALLAGVAMLLSMCQHIDQIRISREMVFKGYHALCGLMAFVVALGCGNDDRERGTLWMLRALPFGTRRLLAEKSLVCGLLIGLFLLLSELVLWPMSHFGNFFKTLGHLPYPSFWRFGTSWPLTIAQFICLVLVGLAAGVRYNNFVTAAVVGLGVYVVWYTGWVLTGRPLEASSSGHFHTLMVLQQLMLAGTAGFGFVRFARYYGGGNLITSSDRTGTASQKVRSLLRWNFQLLGESYVSAYRGRIIGAALWLSLLAWAFMFIAPAFIANTFVDDIQIVVLTPVLAGAFLGCLVFNRNELIGFRGQLYFQPISRWRLLKPRVILVGICTLIMTSAPIILTGFLGELGLSVLPFIAMGAAYLAATLRLLFRNAIFATIITFVIIGFWMLLAFTGNTVLAIESKTSATMTYQVWLMAVFGLWPLVCLYLAYVKSSLLSLGGTARSFLGISAAFTIFATGCLLIAMIPVEAIWLILNWIETAGAGVS